MYDKLGSLGPYNTQIIGERVRIINRRIEHYYRRKVSVKDLLRKLLPGKRIPVIKFEVLPIFTHFHPIYNEM